MGAILVILIGIELAALVLGLTAVFWTACVAVLVLSLVAMLWD